MPETLVPGTGGSRSGLRPKGLLWLALLLGAVGLGVTAIHPPDPAAAQSIERGLFADSDSATREVLAFLGRLGRTTPRPWATCSSPSTRASWYWRDSCWSGTRPPASWTPRGGPLRLRRLGDRPHRYGRRPDGAAAGRHERRPARGGGPRPSRRRLRQRGLEALSPRRRWPRAGPSFRARARRSGAPRSRGRSSPRHAPTPPTGAPRRQGTIRMWKSTTTRTTAR